MNNKKNINLPNKPTRQYQATMKLKNILIEAVEGVDTATIKAPHDLTTLIKQHCVDAWDAATKKFIYLYRGYGTNTPKVIGNYALVKPAARHRVASMLNNYVMPIIEHSPAWHNFPKRSRSIICSNQQLGAYGYGDMYCIFPFDGAKFGVYKEPDFWSFPEEKFKPYDLISIRSFTMLLDTMQSILLEKTREEIKVTNFEDIQKVFKEFAQLDPHQALNKFKQHYSVYNQGIFLFVEKVLSPDNLKFIEELLQPPKSGSVYVANSMQEIKREYLSEVWTDSNCIVIKKDWFEDNKDNLAQRIATT